MEINSIHDVQKKLSGTIWYSLVWLITVRFWSMLVFRFQPVLLNPILFPNWTWSGPWSKVYVSTGLYQELHFLHSNNIVHRDLKPSNILMDLSRKHIKFCDFGCSKRILGNPDSHRSTPLVTSRFYRYKYTHSFTLVPLSYWWALHTMLSPLIFGLWAVVILSQYFVMDSNCWDSSWASSLRLSWFRWRSAC